LPVPVHETSLDAVEATLTTTAAASPALGETAVSLRAEALRAAARALDTASEELTELAATETSLDRKRLSGEVARTTGQLRMFAAGLVEGSWLDIIIDTADPHAIPTPRPDLRRMELPIGPVLVFAAGNFPFAFSVAGGDTASALAAGCPVIVKTHPGHPHTSARVAGILAEAVEEAGLPRASVAVLQGEKAGVQALRDPRIQAASFTGSLGGGRALSTLAAEREPPIPFYAEMGSLNPVFVSPGAVSARGASITDGYVASFTLGVGQFCTKPGLLFLPAGHGLSDRLAQAAGSVPPGRMLQDRIRIAHHDVRDMLAGRPGMRVIALPQQARHGDDLVTPTLLATDVDALMADAEAVLTECFGPTSVIVEYDDLDAAVTAASSLDGSLTATVHAEPSETDFVRRLLPELRRRAGRLVFNGWPTGVDVSWAMHHGGPYPATSLSAFTSVGMTAIRRFLRPVCYQDFPQHLLPPVLRDENLAGLPRRVNGALTTDDVPRT